MGFNPFSGRPFLHKYGEVLTFVCHFLPAIRQLTSIPAGLSCMNLWRFSLFTGLGTGICTAVLAGVGYYFGYLTENMIYRVLIKRVVEVIDEPWILAGLGLFVAAYFYVQNKIMSSCVISNNTPVEKDVEK